jgi:AcrR family transcriptional regulator
MKHPTETTQSEKTRRAILNALAEVIVETGGLGFSIQQVADRAAVTHRTVYNHFPTREALNDALAVHVEDELARTGASPPSALALEELAPTVEEVYRVFEAHEVHIRAYVMLMVASRGPAGVARQRMSAMEEMIGREVVVRPPLTPRGLAAAVRMFVSSTGWHLLTEQLGLSSEEARATAAWATRALLRAATEEGHTHETRHHEEARELEHSDRRSHSDEPGGASAG